MSSVDPSSPLSPGAPAGRPADPEVLAGVPDTADRYDSPDEQAAAALVDISGASKLTLDGFEAGIPPNMAAASALVDELTVGGGVSTAAFGSLYTLMDSEAVLALTSD